MRFSTLSAATLFIGLAIGGASADTVRIDTARGPVDIAPTPARIAVYDIGALDSLTALGVEVAGVPENVFLDHLEPVAEAAEPVGTLFEPDYEALNALEPDLIIAGGRSSPKVVELSALAPTIDVTVHGDDTLTQTVERLATYGVLFDKEEEAAALTAEVDGAIARFRALAEGRGKVLIVLTNGPKISVYGPGSRFGWIHTDLGLEPATADLPVSIHGEAVSFEFIRSVNPDWLIIVDRASAISGAASNAAATLDNALIAETRAWSSDQVVYLNAADIYIGVGGVRALTDTIDTLTRAFDGTD